MQIKLFDDKAPDDTTPPEPPAAEEPVAEPPAAEVSAFAGERPDDLGPEDEAAWQALSASSGWAAMRRIPSMAPLVAELGLAVAYADRRLVALGKTAHEARMISGPGLMVPALAGISPWQAAQQVLGGGEE